MGICTDDHVSGYSKAFFRKQRMLDSHLTHFKIIGNLVAACKFTHTFAVLRRFDIFVRHKMIRYKGDFVFMEHTVHVHFLHLLDGNRARNVVAQYQIQVCLDQLTGLHVIKSCMGRQNFLRHCHSHICIILLHRI